MLITRSNGRTTGTSVSAVTENRVVSEGVDYTVCADQHTVRDVPVNLVLIDGDTRNADVTGVAGANTVCAIKRDVAIPNENIREGRLCCVGKNAIRGVVGEYAIACRHSGT